MKLNVWESKSNSLLFPEKLKNKYKKKYKIAKTLSRWQFPQTTTIGFFLLHLPLLFFFLFPPPDFPHTRE